MNISTSPILISHSPSGQTIKNNPFDDMDEPLTPAQLLITRRIIKNAYKRDADLLEKRIQYIVELQKLNKLEQK
jgi:hypothetical protein